MRKILILGLFSLLLISCGGNNKGNIEKQYQNTEQKVETTASNKGEDTTKKIEKEFKVIDISNTTKVLPHCENETPKENCTLNIKTVDYGTYEIPKKYMMINYDEDNLVAKAYYNPKYKDVYVSFFIAYADQIGITETAKINVENKSITILSKTFGELFYFKDVDTIIPKYNYDPNGGGITTQEELKAIKLGKSNKNTKKSGSLSGAEFIKKYYTLLGEKKLNEVFDITSWATKTYDFSTFKSWYMDIKKVDLVKIEDLGDNTYQITVDIYEYIRNKDEDGYLEDGYGTNYFADKGDYYLADFYLYTRTVVKKKIIEKDGIKKLETIKVLNNYKLPHMKAHSNKHLTDKDLSEESLYDIGGRLYLNKKLSNGKTFLFSDSVPHDGNMNILIYGKKGDIDDYYSLYPYFPGEFFDILGVKKGEGGFSAQMDEIKVKMTKMLKEAPDDMLEKVLYR